MKGQKGPAKDQSQYHTGHHDHFVEAVFHQIEKLAHRRVFCLGVVNKEAGDVENTSEPGHYKDDV